MIKELQDLQAKLELNTVNVVIDLSIVLYANYFVCLKYIELDELTADKLAETCASNIVNIARNAAPLNSNTNIILAADTHKINWRKKYYDGYKLGREPKKRYRKLAKKATKILATKFTVLSAPAMEADDIAYLVSISGSKAVLCSNDGDWSQMINKSTAYYHIAGKSMYDYDFYGLDGLLTIEATKIVMGCSTDTVPRLIAPRKRAKVINEMMSVYVSALSDKVKLQASLSTKLSKVNCSVKDHKLKQLKELLIIYELVTDEVLAKLDEALDMNYTLAAYDVYNYKAIYGKKATKNMIDEIKFKIKPD